MSEFTKSDHKFVSNDNRCFTIFSIAKGGIDSPITSLTSLLEKDLSVDVLPYSIPAKEYFWGHAG
jgi:hypothetical protein